MDDKWTVFEPKSRRYFKATLDTVMKTADLLNKKIKTNGIKWNEVFDAFNIPGLPLFENWPFEYDEVSLYLDFSIKTDDFVPVIVIDYIKK